MVIPSASRVNVRVVEPLLNGSVAEPSVHVTTPGVLMLKEHGPVTVTCTVSPTCPCTCAPPGSAQLMVSGVSAAAVAGAASATGASNAAIRASPAVRTGDRRGISAGSSMVSAVWRRGAGLLALVR